MNACHSCRFWPDFWSARPGVWDLVNLPHHDPWTHHISAWPDGEQQGAPALLGGRKKGLGLLKERPSGVAGQLQTESGQILLDR